ncbi:MAG: cupredoxin family copper-binding protein [Catenulispora sp.]|nr:cupredoxin family copper-binding protein [Catenulispora sp.]
MTRPLTPRLPGPWRPRPAVPLLTLATLGVGIATSAGVGLRTGEQGSGAAAPIRPVIAAAPVAPAIAPRAAVAASSHSIQIVGFAFAPQSLTISVGDSITWTNQDEAPHTVTTTSGPQSISSPMLSKGQSFTFSFTAPGTYSYYCAVHPDMRAQVVVTPAAAPSTPSAPAKSSTPPAPPVTHSSAAGTTHSAAPSTARSEHSAPSSAAPASTSSAAAAAPPASSAPSAASAAAPPAAAAPSTSVPPGSPTSSAPAAPAPAATDAAAAPAATTGSSTNPLDPTLVLAGLTAGATVYCLLLVASRRPGTARGEDEP